MNDARIRRNIVALGGSAGSVGLILDLFAALPDQSEASFFVVIHRSPHFESQMTELLQRRTALRVREPDHEEPVKPGHLYLAPRDRHMRVRDGVLTLDRGPKHHFTRPALDPLFSSVADGYGRRVLGVVYSGGGADGASGLIAIKRGGGIGIVQDPFEAEHPSMPATGIARDDVDAVLKSHEIVQAISALVAGEALPSEPHVRGPVHAFFKR